MTNAPREALDQAIVRGSELLKQGKLDQAQRAFRAALELDPDNLKVLALLGLAHFRANEFEAARPIYETLCERAMTDASHRLNLGLVYLKLNNADKAIAALEASRALDPSQGRAVSYLGLAYARAGRFAEAYRAFLLAGQNELAMEIEVNLSTTERDAILAQLGRTRSGSPFSDVTPVVSQPIAISRTRTPVSAPPSLAEDQPRTYSPSPHVIPRTSTPSSGISRTTSEPRTRPPSAPPSKRDLAYKAAAAVELVARREVPKDAEPGLFESSPEITITRPEAELDIRPLTPGAGMSESQRFVIAKPDPAAPQAELAGASMLSMAVASATPHATTAPRTMSGAFSARPLAELATEDLVRPDDGTDSFEIAANGVLMVRVAERVLTRLDGVHITGGDLAFEVATRRSRGHQTDERFDGSPMHVVSGTGYLLAVPDAKHSFLAVSLDDDILYVREDLVFAFEASLRWENGNVPGLRGKLHVVQFRGDGALALRLARPLVRIKLPPQGLVFVDADRLAGWVGRVIPRAVVPPHGGPLGAMCVECTGEGIVLVEPAPEARTSAVIAPRPPEPPEPPPLLPPEPPQPPEVAPEVAELAADLAAHNARDEI